MTVTEAETETPEVTDEVPRLCKQLLRTADSSRARASVQALAEERTILEMPAVRRALVVDTSCGARADFEGLSGLQYGLGLDEQQRVFLDLVLSMMGIGITTLASVEDLDERRLPIILRAILRLAGNDTIAVGTRL
ncbi:hypothetical protein STAFG_2921 [Streptomyces afghaniensis 772]|uniref:Uncharacterized protein n=1 Tax=Streptomyces afghaniensis 772 TaxID=1283301 RepID=S4NNV4_9ACTN|nr:MULTISPECIES: hypothetical protein [Streptomyces]EPJ40049.1 hypothetical protein STAFG_2921 [Streptomyces afghaniensis 772]UOB12033.1 hypothetical protein MQE23_24540 [Streptomyces sp. HP-A2021]